MSYWQYWKLNAAPFASGARNAFFRGQSVEEALARIEFVCGQRRNLATLVGRAGMGKSALLSYLVSHPPRIESTAAQDVCAVSMMGLAAGELPMEFARKLSGRRVMNATEGWSSLSDCFNSCMRGDASCLLLIDDVECCTAEAEGDLVRMVRAASDSHISVILAIESHLASTVSRWLMERSYLQIELPPWDLEQTDDFLRFSMARCGRRSEVFTPTAVQRLHELSQGTPRRLIQLADLALVAGAVAHCSRIDPSLIGQVAQELPTQVSKAA